MALSLSCPLLISRGEAKGERERSSPPSPVVFAPFGLAFPRLLLRSVHAEDTREPGRGAGQLDPLLWMEQERPREDGLSSSRRRRRFRRFFRRSQSIIRLDCSLASQRSLSQAALPNRLSKSRSHPGQPLETLKNRKKKIHPSRSTSRSSGRGSSRT